VCVSGKRFIVISLFIIVFETTIFFSSAFQLGSMRHAPFTCRSQMGDSKASVKAGRGMPQKPFTRSAASAASSTLETATK